MGAQLSATCPRRASRLAVSLIAALIGALIASLAVSAPAHAGPTQDFYAATNAARAGAGLPPLKQASDLAVVAQGWADRMASTGKLAHNPNLQTQVKNWRYVGENVGTGGTVDAIQDAFMKSANHRSNILDTDFTEVGIGTATRFNDDCQCNVIYVTVNFRQPLKAPAPSAPPAPPAPAPTAKASPAPTKPPATPKPAAQTSTKPATKPPASRPPATPSPPAPPAPSSLPSPSPLAETLKAQLAAAAATHPSSAEDPVSQALDFAALMARLG